MALQISDQFGQLVQLSHLKGEPKKPDDIPRTIKQDSILQLLVRPINPPDKSLVKSKMVPGPYQKVVTIFV